MILNGLSNFIIYESEVNLEIYFLSKRGVSCLISTSFCLFLSSPGVINTDDILLN
jgi:hypothetical protein